jgi:hypothetical protein
MKNFMLFLLTVLLASSSLTLWGQLRKPQNKPYIDLRPMHFGISVGLNLQDIEFVNTGPQLLDDGTLRTVVCDADTWNPGFSVGVLADLRINDHLNFRLSPAMHFGAKRLTFRDFDILDDRGLPSMTTQDMKNTYIAMPLELKFSAERFNNYRPYMIGGVSPMINLAGKDQEAVQLKRFDTMVELGLGCDFYLPFFKFIPELKFCYGLGNVLDTNHINEITDITTKVYSQSVTSASSKMIVLSFYFE